MIEVSDGVPAEGPELGGKMSLASCPGEVYRLPFVLLSEFPGFA